jgi:flagellar motor protein MotB
MQPTEDTKMIDLKYSYMARISAFITVILSTPALASTGAVSEIIYFLEEDGQHALVYTTVRSENASYQMQMLAPEATTEVNEDFIYIFPEEHEWQAGIGGLRTIKLSNGNFATLRRVNLASASTLTRNDAGDLVFHTPSRLSGLDRRGIWNSPDGFAHIAYTWIFPKTFEPVEYTANKEGSWSERANAITYYGSNVNDLMFSITYRSRLSEVYEELRSMFGDDDDITVTEDADGVRVSIEATLLYPSGVAKLSSNGRERLTRVSTTLKKNENLRIIVEGHTDSDRIVGQLADRFPTNWELSSARSINVIRYLISLGIADHRFESRAFSSTRPLFANSTDEGKAKNRRIELLLAEE